MLAPPGHRKCTKCIKSIRSAPGDAACGVEVEDDKSARPFGFVGNTLGASAAAELAGRLEHVARRNEADC